MKKILLSFLLLPVALSAGALVGYRFDRFSWTITGRDGLSELEWRDLQSVVLGFESQLPLCNGYLIDFWGDFGTIISGTNLDSDFDCDNRTCLTSKVLSQAAKGNLFDASLGAGRTFSTHLGTVTPLLGISIHGQLLRFYDGVSLFPVQWKIQGLDSHYKALWQTIWTGFEHKICLTSRLEGFLRAELHYAFYSARGFWNLRDDFKGEITHRAEGLGGILSCGAKYHLTERLGVGLRMLYQTWRACHGTHSVPLLLESNEVRKVTARLNEVISQSTSLFFDLSYCF